MKYPKAGDLQRDTASHLVSNPWEVRSDSGLEGVFGDKDEANGYADELRGSGARGVRVAARVQFRPPRPGDAPPMYHQPRGRPPGVPNPSRFREGTRVRFMPSPASLQLYGTAPPIGTTGTVTSVSLGSRRAVYLPGPGGGLTYVNWDGFGVQGVSPGDLERVGRRNPSQYTARGQRVFKKIHAKLIAEGMDPAIAAMSAEMAMLDLAEQGDEELFTPDGLRETRAFFGDHPPVEKVRPAWAPTRQKISVDQTYAPRDLIVQSLARIARGELEDRGIQVYRKKPVFFRAIPGEYGIDPDKVTAVNRVPPSEYTVVDGYDLYVEALLGGKRSIEAEVLPYDEELEWIETEPNFIPTPTRYGGLEEFPMDVAAIARGETGKTVGNPPSKRRLAQSMEYRRPETLNPAAQERDRPRLGNKYVLGTYAPGSRVQLGEWKFPPPRRSKIVTHRDDPGASGEGGKLMPGEWVTIIRNSADTTGVVAVKLDSNNATVERDGLSPLWEVEPLRSTRLHQKRNPEPLDFPAPKFIVVGKSTRTGAPMFLRDDGGPTKHRSEAGRFSMADANLQIADAARVLPKWTFTMERS